ncbi:hypothetical protein [Timonella sp. A28]|uniref:hypothetical protein n=1 Tax=Timonella sp. A28 TaxID=3442640 RepID=UPI003EBD25EE
MEPHSGHDDTTNSEDYDTEAPGNGAPPKTPQWVYWMRRILALVIVGALIVLVVFAVKAVLNVFSSDEPEKQSTSSATTDSDKKKDSTQEPATPTPDETTQAAQRPQACDPAQIKLTVSTASKELPAGTPMTFTLQASYKGEEPCILDVSAQETTVTMYSGEDRIWARSDCDATGSKPMYMEKSAKATLNIAWDGQRSTKKCADDRPLAKAGTYRVVAQYETAKSKDLVFQLTK